MNAAPSQLRRLAVTLARHAARTLPGPPSSWAQAMRHELDYIADDSAALRWALGCLLASCKARLTHRLRSSRRAVWRQVATSGALMLLIGLALQEHAASQTEPPQPAFDETICDLPGISPELRPRLQCGTVSVPRNYDKHDAGRFKLAVVVIKSEQQPAWPEPVVYVSGGPGYPLTVYAAHQARTPYAPRRDLILVDQRGTGRSEPDLCPDLGGKLLETALALAASPTEEAFAARQAAYSACRDQALHRGLDLRDFGTRVTAEDLEWVRKALQIKRWNVYGESYGTTVAMTLAALHPDTIRTVVLDSIYPPDPAPLWSTTVNDARDAFFANCARDTACATSFPNLAETYRETLTRLEHKPPSVTVPPKMRQPDDRVLLTGSLFEAVVTNLLYYPTAYPDLPRVIESAHDGEPRDLGQLLGPILAAQLAAAATQNRATHAAVECRDRPHYRQDLPAGAHGLDRRQLYGICARWSDPGPLPLVPTATRIPTLVLAGQFDPVARPALSRHVAELIGNSARFVEFPRVGHNVRQFSSCGAKVAADFIDHPAQELDTSCTNRAAPIPFVPKRR